MATDPNLTEFLTRALAEDVGQGDITTAATVGANQQGRARIVVKEPRLVFCGGNLFEEIFSLAGAAPKMMSLKPEGAELTRGECAAEIHGRLRGLLTGERTALNLAALLSGIATQTAEYVRRVAGTKARIVDTRKTHPGLRTLEKYAVRVGGGFNHRFGLDSGVLIKENHIAAAGSVPAALSKARALAPHTMKIEIECETLEQVDEALKAGAEAILLDNMSPAQIRFARSKIGGAAIVEVSGGINLDNVREYAEAGADLISVGALTHSVRSVDLSMRIEAL